MVKRRKVDASQLTALVAGTEGQVVSGGVRKTYDPAFPVFGTPINKDVLVYIPRTNVLTTENGEILKMLEFHAHDYTKGKQYGTIRCIHGLQNEIFDALGYDGTCPACEAMEGIWDLYNAKLDAACAKNGVNREDDNSETVKSFRSQFSREMDLKKADEYVVFPIVIIPFTGKFVPTEEALETLEPQYVCWKKKRYEECIASEFEALIDPPEHMGGTFMIWRYTYKVDAGKAPNARDSAKNAKFAIVTDAKLLSKYEYLVAKAEEVASPFTVEKAAEVIVAAEFLFKEDIEAEVQSIMKRTNTMLELMQVQEAAPTGAVQIAAGSSDVDNALSGFKIDTAKGDLGTEATPAGAGPVQFN
ncbi:hypothetical protein D3C81_08950 [compost metagenome]